MSVSGAILRPHTALREVSQNERLRRHAGWCRPIAVDAPFIIMSLRTDKLHGRISVQEVILLPLHSKGDYRPPTTDSWRAPGNFSPHYPHAPTNTLRSEAGCSSPHPPILIHAPKKYNSPVADRNVLLSRMLAALQHFNCINALNFTLWGVEGGERKTTSYVTPSK